MTLLTFAAFRTLELQPRDRPNRPVRPVQPVRPAGLAGWSGLNSRLNILTGNAKSRFESRGPPANQTF